MISKPQSDPPTFKPGDAELIRRVANMTERTFAVEYKGSAPGDYLQRLRDIAVRVQAECDSGSPSDFTKEDLAPLETAATNLHVSDPRIDPNKSNPAERNTVQSRRDAASAADRIAAIIKDRLQRD